MMTDKKILDLIQRAKNDINKAQINCNNKLNKKDNDLNDHIELSGKRIDENEDAVLDIATLADENSLSILDLVEYIESLEERIVALEEAAGLTEEE